MKPFRKKPVTIQAIQWDGSVESGEKIAALLPAVSIHWEGRNDPRPPRLSIATLEGVMTARAGDWIIRGVAGEVYPCKPDIFAATYDAVTAPEIGRACYAYVDVPYTDDDGIPADFPGREGSDDRGVIVFKLDLNTGKIIGWPEGRHEGLLLLVGHNAAVTVTDSDDDVLQDLHGRLPDWLPVTGGAFVVDIQGDGSITIDDGKTWVPDRGAIGEWIDEERE